MSDLAHQRHRAVRHWLQSWLGSTANWLDISSAPSLLDDLPRRQLGAGLFVIEPAGLVHTLYTEWETAPTGKELAPILQRMAAEAPSGFAYLVGSCASTGDVIIGVALQGHGRPRVWRGQPASLAADQRSLLESPPFPADVPRETPGDRIVAAASEAWRTLGRTALTRRFLRSVAGHMRVLDRAWTGRDMEGEERRRLSLLLVCRLLFLVFVQERGWLPGGSGFLQRWLLEPGVRDLWAQRLVPLFRALAGGEGCVGLDEVPYLNGGLFEADEGEATLRVSDVAVRPLLEDILQRYRFSVQEAGEGGCIDPEMLGLVFESWMSPDQRGRDGAFYTPPGLVERLVDEALAGWLAAAGVLREPETIGDWWAVPATEFVAHIGAERAAAIPEQVATIRVLDPACGSGAFLVALAARLARLWHLATGGQTTESEALRRVLATGIHGVDRSRTACMLCTLRLWLLWVSRAAEGRHGVAALPNLDHRIRQGDALSTPTSVTLTSRASLPPTLVQEWRATLVEWSHASGPLKAEVGRRRDRLARALHEARWGDLVERRKRARDEARWAVDRQDLFGRRDRVTVAAQTALTRAEEALASALAMRDKWSAEDSGAFDPAVDFADVFADGGFDIVIGNPPWVRMAALPTEERISVRERFGWMRKLPRIAAPSPRGFGVQPDLSVAFVQQSLAWSKRGRGIVAMVLPAKIFRAPYGEAMRDGLFRGSRLLRLADLSRGGGRLFDASVYPAVIVARRRWQVSPGALGVGEEEPPIRLGGIHQNERLVLAEDLSLHGDGASSWPLVPRETMQVLRRMMEAAPRLERSLPVRMGIKTGANDVFLNAPVVAVEARLVLRGRSRDGVATDTLLFGHDLVDGSPLPAVSVELEQWVRRHGERLRRRSDARPWEPLWSVYRVAPELLGHRVVWTDLAMSLEPMVLPPVVDGGPLVLNTLYGIGAPDALRARRWAAWLASGPIGCLVDAIAEPALNGYQRLQAHVVEQVPFPRWLLAPAAPESELPAWLQQLDEAAAAYGTPGYRRDAVDRLVLHALGLPSRSAAHLRGCHAGCTGPMGRGA